jgi:DNA-binding FadR family transcriptional regulator
MSEHIGSVEPRRLYQQIADRVRLLIREGHFPAGSRLPAERELAHQLGVSRPSLREALIALEIAGNVEIRMGSGIYVAAEETRLPAQGGSIGESPLEIMQARSLIEGSAVIMACSQINTEALERLRGNLDAMRLQIEAERKPIELDRQFHLIIAEQSGNSVVARIVRDLFDERHSPLTAQPDMRMPKHGHMLWQSTRRFMLHWRRGIRFWRRQRCERIWIHQSSDGWRMSPDSWAHV